MTSNTPSLVNATKTNMESVAKSSPKNNSSLSGWKQKRKAKLQSKKRARHEWKKTGVGWRVFPRTLIGILFAILMFSAGTGVSGAVLFAYYEARVTESENKIAEFSSELDKRVAEGAESLRVTSQIAEDRLTSVLGPFSDLIQNENGIPTVAGLVTDSVVLVETANLSGSKEIGSAVSVGSSENQTIFLTSLDVVEAAKADPAPAITLRKGESTWSATLTTWDERLGIAILIANETGLPAAPFAPLEDLGILTGSPVFSLSALNNSVITGSVVAVTRDGFRHTGIADQDFRGGPIVGQKGEIVGFTNNTYAPAGFQGGSAPWAPTIIQLCETLLRCESSNVVPR